jgi:hypothetical protein
MSERRAGVLVRGLDDRETASRSMTPPRQTVGNGSPRGREAHPGCRSRGQRGPVEIPPVMTQRQMHAMYIEAEERRRRLKSPLVPLRERRMRVGNA